MTETATAPDATHAPAEANGSQPTDNEQQHAAKISRALTAYDRIGDVSSFVANFGQAIANSKMFGCSNVDQGRVLAMACACERTNPLAILRKYHLMGGKLTMRADAMLADFKAIGGDYTIVSRTPDKAAVEMKPPGRGKKAVMFEFAWAEARVEDYVYTKEGNAGSVPKNLPDGTVNPRALKDNWSTPRRRMQMLWARVVSDAVRAVAPEVNAGSYTPEELGGGAADDGGEVIDAEFTVLPESRPQAATEFTDAMVSTAVESLKSAPHPGTRMIDQQHMDAIRDLTAKCGLDGKAMGDYCQQEFGRLPKLMELTMAEASQIIGYLTKRLDGSHVAPVATPAAVVPATVTAPATDKPTVDPTDPRRPLLQELKSLRTELLTLQQYNAVLEKNYNVGSALSLNLQQLEKLVGGLRARKVKRDAEAAAAGKGTTELDQWANGALQQQPAAAGASPGN